MNEIPRWDAWLAQPECLITLERVARFVVRQAGRIGFPDGMLPCEHLQNMSPRELEDCARAVAHDLWVFLRTRSDSWKERTALQWLSELGERFLIHRIGRDYLLHLKDQSRTYGSNPWRALYRRVRQLLQEDEHIHYRATSRGAFYSLEADAPVLTDTQPLQAHPYDQWESPFSVSPAAELHRKDRLLELARFFWKQAAVHLGSRGHYLPVRELVHYLGRHYAHLITSPTRPASEPPMPQHEDVVASIPQPGADLAPEHSIVRSRLDDLAECLVASWIHKQRRAFYLLHGEELTLEAAADRMGYKGASGVSYVYRTALERLRDFCLLWPGISPPDLDEVLFDEFVEHVLAICKKDF